MAEIPTDRELDAFRDRADRFIADLDEEHYLHFAGHKESLDLEDIYARYPELTSLETAQGLKGGPTELWRFACEGYLGNLTRSHQEKVATIEAELEATVDGEVIPFRMLRIALANEPDRDRRERLDQVRLELTDEHLNPVYLEAAQIDREAVSALGAPNYYELYKQFGFRLDELARECRDLLDETERAWEQAGDRAFRARLGVGLGDARPSDVARLFRAPEWDKAFPSDRMVPALEATLTDLGIDLQSQSNIHLDLEQRPAKSPRPFCAPIEIPDRVMLVIQPTGGRDDWAALFHEAGHAEHFANTSADLPMEAKRLGDMAVTEGWAALLEHLVSEPAWLNRRLDVPRVDELADEGATALLYFVRRYSAKLLYEIEFFQAADPAAMRPRYGELLTDALKIEANSENYLTDIDGSFYVTGYLRSWAFEAQLRDFLRSEFGNTWFTHREAGDLLRELWSLGQGPTAEELRPQRHWRDARDGIGCRADCRRSRTLRKWPMCTQGASWALSQYPSTLPPLVRGNSPGRGYKVDCQGIRQAASFVFLDMSTLNDIKQEIDRLSSERLDVLAKLSDGKNAELAAKHQQLEERIAELWELQRVVRARIRFGDRNDIIQRARHDERLSRAA